MALGTHLPAALQTFLTSTVRMEPTSWQAPFLFFFMLFSQKEFFAEADVAKIILSYVFFLNQNNEQTNELLGPAARRPLLLQCFYGAAC